MKLTAMLLFCVPAFAQNTLSYDSKAGSPEANLKDMIWLSGHWQGEAFGGPIEEIWSPPRGESMMFSFKSMRQDGTVRFYEFGTISEEKGSLILKFKHFNADMTGWEEKDKFMEYRLVKITDDAAYFDDFTFKKRSDEEIAIYVIIETKDGTSEEMPFYYKKIAP